MVTSHAASTISEIERAARLGLGLRKPLTEAVAETGAARIKEKLESLEGMFYRPDPFLARFPDKP